MVPLFDSSSHLLWQTGAGSSEVLHVRLGAALPIIQDEVCGHFALQTGDVAMAEVITQVMHLQNRFTFVSACSGVNIKGKVYIFLSLS